MWVFFFLKKKIKEEWEERQKKEKEEEEEKRKKKEKQVIHIERWVWITYPTIFVPKHSYMNVYFPLYHVIPY